MEAQLSSTEVRAKAFDSCWLAVIRPQLATSADGEDLVRIEGTEYKSLLAPLSAAWNPCTVLPRGTVRNRRHAVSDRVTGRMGWLSL